MTRPPLVRAARSIGLVSVTGMLFACSPSSETVSFQADVQPILQEQCVSCHQQPDGKGYEASGLLLTSYEGIMEGTTLGPVVQPGEPLNSTLIRLVEGKADPSIAMPHNESLLPEAQRETLRLWVAQGAKNN